MKKHILSIVATMGAVLSPSTFSTTYENTISDKIITGKYRGWDDSGDRIKSIDINGDSIDDVLIGPDRDGNWYVLQNQDGNFVDTGKILSGKYGNWDSAGTRIHITDFNIDGLDDVLIGPDRGGHWYGLQNTRGGLRDVGRVIKGKYGRWDKSADRIKLFDYNADGKEDILIGPDRGGRWYVLRNNGGSYSDLGAVISGKLGDWDDSGSRIKVVDYNVDGYDDVLVGPNNRGNWYGLKNNSGRGFTQETVLTGAFSAWDNAGDRINIADINADGIDDIVLGPKGERNGVWFAAMGTGSGFKYEGPIARGYKSWYQASSRIKPMQINSDGYEDILIGPNSSGDWYMLDLINRPEFKAGYDIITTIYYEGVAHCVAVGSNTFLSRFVSETTSSFVTLYGPEYFENGVWLTSSCISSIPFSRSTTRTVVKTPLKQ